MKLNAEQRAIIAASILTVAFFRLMKYLGALGSFVPLKIMASLFFATGICWGLRSKTRDVSIPLALLSGLAIGGTIDAIYGYAVAHEDRGQFLIEILLYLVP